LIGVGLDKPRILFLGKYNASSSQIGEALMRKYTGDRFEIYSAGLYPRPIDPCTIRVLAETGCDTGRLYSKTYSELLGKMSFSLVIVVYRNMEEVFNLNPGFSMVIRWDLCDPEIHDSDHEQHIYIYRQLRDRIEQKVVEFIREQT
jgi:arsenate reductase